MPLFNRPNLNARVNAVNAMAKRVKVEQNATHARATLTMPNGKKHQCVIRCDTPEALMGELDRLAGSELGAEDDELGGFFKKLGRGLKKAVVTPVKLAHKYTHEVGPIAKLHKQVQNGVAKALPFTKPFIGVHNSLAAPVHKAIEGKKIKNALTAKEIAKVTANLPAAKKGAVQAALVAESKKADALQTIAKSAAKATVIAQAKRAAKAGDKEAKSFLKSAARGTTGFYEVKPPGSSRIIKVPASKVAHS